MFNIIGIRAEGTEQVINSAPYRTEAEPGPTRTGSRSLSGRWAASLHSPFVRPETKRRRGQKPTPPFCARSYHYVANTARSRCCGLPSR
jgi:hypothetical protein